MPPSGPLPVRIRLHRYSFSSASSNFFSDTLFRDLSEESSMPLSSSLQKFAKKSSPLVTENSSIPNSTTESSGPASLGNSPSVSSTLLRRIICRRTSRRRRCGQADSALANELFSKTCSPVVCGSLAVVGFFFFALDEASSFVESAVDVVLTLSSSGSSGLGHISTVRKASSTITCSSFPTKRISKVPICPDFPRRRTISSSLYSSSSSSWSLHISGLSLVLYCEAFCASLCSNSSCSLW
mmetsp:Transcript_20442/g.30348  ORF Transcript_20442/g.30348 Transcript_20442/m.30348 type:complete len:240 (-) Transcript_20442:367-1086(-)